MTTDDCETRIEDMTTRELREEIVRLRAESANTDYTSPCDHYDDHIGNVWAGDEGHRKGPYHAVGTCAPCAIRCLGYVQLKAGVMHAGTLMLYPEYASKEFPTLEDTGIQFDRSYSKFE